MKSTKQNRKTTHRKSSSRNKKKDDEKQFPGYPRYSPEEDIMNKAKRVELDLDGEEITKKNIPHQVQKKGNPDLNEPLSEPLIDNQSQITKEDLEALGPRDLSLDMGDDENLLKHRVYPVDFAANDIDVPGSELDGDGESIGSEDEENHIYSIGGDSHEDLEEDHT